MKEALTRLNKAGKVAVLFLATFLAFYVNAFAAENPWSEIEERRRAVAAIMEAATVWVVGEDDERIVNGSGFIVGDGLIVTNAHVVNGLGRGKVIYVLNDSLPVCKARVIATAYDEKSDAVGGRDFALLSFTPPANIKLPVLSFNLEVRRMDRVSAWGYPVMITQFDKSTARMREGDTSGLTAPPVVYTEGSINSIVTDRLGASLIHSAPIAGGNSGGPLVNSRGEVVGINTWGYTEEDEGAFVNAAQPSSQIIAFLRENGVTPKLATGQQVASAPPKPQPETLRPSQPETFRPSQPETFRPSQPETFRPSQPEILRPSQPERVTREDRRRDVGSFSVLVPREWSVIEEDWDSILLGADDQSVAVLLMVADLKDRSLRYAAEALSRKMGGTRPELIDEVYTFTYSSGGIDTSVFVVELDNKEQCLIVSISGDAERPEVEEILDSLEDS